MMPLANIRFLEMRFDRGTTALLAKAEKHCHANCYLIRLLGLILGSDTPAKISGFIFNGINRGFESLPLRSVMPR